MRTFLALSLLLTIAAVPFMTTEEDEHPVLHNIGAVMAMIGFPGLIISGLFVVLGSVGNPGL